MAKEFTMEMKGARELEQLMLKNLPAKVARSQMLAGMRASAKPMVSYAKAIVAKDSHALKISIGMRTLPVRKTMKRAGMESAAAALQLGPMSGTGSNALKAWAVYKAHHGQQVDLKRGVITGRIRHGHLVEFGFRHTSGKQVPARPFMEPAAKAMAPTFVNRFVRETRKRVERAIQKHNATSRGPR